MPVSNTGVHDMNFSGKAIGSSLRLLPRGYTYPAGRRSSLKNTIDEKPRIHFREVWTFLDEGKTSDLVRRNCNFLTSDTFKNIKEAKEKSILSLDHPLQFSGDALDRWGEHSSVEKTIFGYATSNSHTTRIKQSAKRENATSRYSIIKHMPCYPKANISIEGKDESSSSGSLLCPSRRSTPSSGQLSVRKSKSKEPHIQVSSESKAMVDASKKLSWDKYLLMLLSDDTADFIVKHASQRQRQHSNPFSEFRSSPTIWEKSHDQKDSYVGKTNTESVAALDVPANGEKSSPVVNSSELKAKKCTLISGDEAKVKHTIQNVVQASFPLCPSPWSEDKGADKKVQSKVDNQGTKSKVVRGYQKWTDYPLLWEPPNFGMDVVPSDVLNPATEQSSKFSEKVKLPEVNEDILKISTEWKNQWFLERKFMGNSFDELVAAMRSVNDHTRLAAVSACCRSYFNSSDKSGPKKAGIYSTAEALQSKNMIVQETLKLLDDTCNEVKLAAAITLSTLNAANQKAMGVLLAALKTGAPPDRWAAAQCLAYAECAQDAVLKELLHAVNSPDISKSYKSAKLLGNLSGKTNAIQYMLAEQLNSNSWKDRVTACQLLPLLKKEMSKDISCKLSYLMWNDWSKDVRIASARALGKTGNGKLVHDKLRERLAHGNETARVDALKKIANLGILTNHLLPPLLRCLQDDYVSVRMEAIKTASSVKLFNEEVVDMLLNIASQDRSWKVKAFALKAIGQMGQKDAAIRSTLLWALCYETQPAVRAEACHSIGCVMCNDEETIKTLQDRLLVEESKLVNREVVRVLNLFGSEPTGDPSMQIAVLTEVERLCSQGNVVRRILEQEENQRYLLRYQKYLQTIDRDDEEQKDFENLLLKGDEVIKAYVLRKHVLEDSNFERDWIKKLTEELRGYQVKEDDIFSSVRKQSVFGGVDLQDSDSEGSLEERDLRKVKEKKKGTS